MQFLPSLSLRNAGMLRSSSSPASLVTVIAALCWLTMLLCASTVQVNMISALLSFAVRR